MIEGLFTHDLTSAVRQLDSVERQSCFLEAARLSQNKLSGLEQSCLVSTEADRNVTTKIKTLEAGSRRLIRGALSPGSELIYWIDKNGYQVMRQGNSGDADLTTLPFRFCDSPLIESSFHNTSEQHPIWTLDWGPDATRWVFVQGAYSAAETQPLLKRTRETSQAAP